MSDKAYAGDKMIHGESGRSLTFGLQETLGRAIVIGRYSDRPFPNEADIAKQHGVSRTVTREAVKMLVAKGLLGARPKQGTFIRPQEAWNLFDNDVLRWLLERGWSPDLLRCSKELRFAIEPAACELAARSSTSEQQAAITAGLERMRAAERGEDDILDADIAFHVAILCATNNVLFSQLRHSVSTAIKASTRADGRSSARPNWLADHLAVHDAILRGDEAAARAAMAFLIRSAASPFQPAEDHGIRPAAHKGDLQSQGVEHGRGPD